MNKLLLLATSLISLCISGNATGAPNQIPTIQKEQAQLIKDSTIKEEAPANPKEGFKNLFSDDENSGFSISKLNPQAISFVEDYMDKYSDDLNKMKGWGKPYFDMMDAVLERHGLPTELKYLCVIES